MAYLNQPVGSRFGVEYAPTSFLLRVGRREIFVCRDFRKRYYRVNPLIDCSAGVEAGHLELLLLRRWLVILSKAH
ncbi:MAG TPA: hypothetical protein VIM12_20900 [Noviherbaspirillum sp.]|jgi:hypothetical protein|uniref:hypothetical protein n=1 Tax=Noviherbaspirillum sp. TaxID=1926288 RepID=UPI002F9341D8